LNAELAKLKTNHEAIVTRHQQVEAEFKQNVVNSQNRYQQLSGAIAQLTDLLNGANGAEQPKKGNKNEPITGGG